MNRSIDRRRPLRTHERLLALINGAWTTQAIHAACLLGLPDLMGRGAMTPVQLARSARCDARALGRLLRALATLGLVHADRAGAYRLRPLGRLLRDDAAGSLRAWALLVGGVQWSPWGELADSVRTGCSYRQRHGAADGFDRLDGDADAAALFHRAMVELTRHAAFDVCAAVDLSRYRRIVDVGGGTGELLAAVLAACPEAHGILFEQPHAIALAGRSLGRPGIAGRWECIAGSFWEQVPGGADLYLLKSVLHNWDDERCRVILRRCAQAMRDHARLLVIERIVPEVGARSQGVARLWEHRARAIARSDLNMLVALSGRERDAAEFDALGRSAGFRTVRIVPTAGDYSVIEWQPAPTA